MKSLSRASGVDFVDAPAQRTARAVDMQGQRTKIRPRLKTGEQLRAHARARRTPLWVERNSRPG